MVAPVESVPIRIHCTIYQYEHGRKPGEVDTVIMVVVGVVAVVA